MGDLMNILLIIGVVVMRRAMCCVRINMVKRLDVIRKFKVELNAYNQENKKKESERMRGVDFPSLVYPLSFFLLDDEFFENRPAAAAACIAYQHANCISKNSSLFFPVKMRSTMSDSGDAAGDGTGT